MQLFVREYGEGDPIIFVHGMLGMSDNWITIAKSFSDENKVLLPDMRNHGLSPHNDIHNFEVMSEDIFELFKEKSIKSSVLIGHSMGAKVVMKFANTHPEMVKKLIIIDISPREYNLNHFEHKDLINHTLLLDYMNNMNLEKFKTKQEINSAIQIKFNQEFIIQLLRKNIVKDHENKYKWKPNSKIIRNSLSELTKETEFNNPNIYFETLFVFGSKSPYFTQDDYAYINNKVSQSKIKIIKDAGHAVHVDKPGELINEIKNFIKN